MHVSVLHLYPACTKPIKPRGTVLNLLLTPAERGLHYFDISAEELKCEKLFTWISNILVLILPLSYQSPPRLCDTLFYEIME